MKCRMYADFLSNKKDLNNKIARIQVAPAYFCATGIINMVYKFPKSQSALRHEFPNVDLMSYVST